jgi:monoamine oxidase
MAARTPLLRVLQGISRDYAAADEAGVTVQEVQAERRRERRAGGLTRRQVLKAGAVGATSAVVGAAVLLGERPAAAATTAPRIAIIGAGIAGLNAALTLQDGTNKVQPYACTIFEAQNYIGGRMHSDATSWANGQVSEWCGELIDSNHTTIMTLASRFKLSLTDLLAAQPAGSTDLYYLFGKYYPYSQAVTDFGPVYTALKNQIHAAGYPTLYNSYNTAGYNLDHMSNYQWIETYVPGGHSSNMGALLDSAYLTEYGLDSTLQSSLNIVYLLGFPPKPVTFSIFGTSDERYHITGGNQQLPRAIASLITTRAPQCTISLGTAMTAIAENADGTYTLTFNGPSGTFTQVFDRVILTLPFSVLRGLTFSGAGFSSPKTYAIDNLGYGTNSKLQLQFSSRYWNLSGQPWGIANDGTTYVDTAFQGGWDVTRGQAGGTGIMVRYAGGTIGASFTKDDQASLDTYAEGTLSLLEAFFPGITPYWNGIVTLSAPWRNPSLLGSYACWTVGQYTSVAGLEKLRQAKCHFAGEHCSINFQGFMEGGAEEGARAAQEIQGDYASGIFP